MLNIKDIDKENEVKNLLPDKKYLDFIRFNNDKTLLAYFDHEYIVAHQSPLRLNIMDWKRKESKTIVDVVNEPKSIDDFPGLFLCGNLQDKIFTSDNKYIVLNSIWRSSNDILKINIETGEISNISEHEKETASIITIDNDNNLFVKYETPNHPPILQIRDLNGKILYEMDKEIKPVECNEMINSFTYEILQVNPRDSKEFKDQYECILYTPKNTKKTPLLVLLHGGPNSCDYLSYSFAIIQFMLMGYSVLRVNYRGSIGFGLNMLNSLAGNIGTQDVHDVEDAIKMVIERPESIIDKDKLMVYGASHGGFLSAHLIGQNPDMFKAAVIQSAVINLANLVSTSDIPDWSIGQSLGKYELENIPILKGEDYEKMKKSSPIEYVNKVKTPSLIFGGTIDKRVNYYNELDYYHILKNNGVKTEYISFLQ